VGDQLKDRVAVITGGTEGIGRGIAEAFLAEGATVVINGRSAEKGARALAELDAGDRAHFIPGDVKSRESLEAIVDGAAEFGGGLHILVNNAGGSSGFNLVGELSDEAWQDALDWNINATFFATRRALQHFVPNRWGRIINISSVEGKEASKPSVSHYITNKHAIHGFTKAVAFEYGPMGITCNAICPGAVETPLMKSAGKAYAESTGMTYEQFLQTYADETMIKRLTTVEEIGGMAVLLASELGGGITGALLNVDGGTASW
jgi:3-hydroxybutyrate dehydrogenase/3-oxoacyl-[acyl-carrier protein] reductase